MARYSLHRRNGSDDEGVIDNASDFDVTYIQQFGDDATMAHALLILAVLRDLFPNILSSSCQDARCLPRRGPERRMQDRETACPLPSWRLRAVNVLVSRRTRIYAVVFGLGWKGVC